MNLVVAASLVLYYYRIYMGPSCFLQSFIPWWREYVWLTTRHWSTGGWWMCDAMMHHHWLVDMMHHWLVGGCVIHHGSLLHMIPWSHDPGSSLSLMMHHDASSGSILLMHPMDQWFRIIWCIKRIDPGRNHWFFESMHHDAGVAPWMNDPTDSGSPGWMMHRFGKPWMNDASIRGKKVSMMHRFGKPWMNDASHH